MSAVFVWQPDTAQHLQRLSEAESLNSGLPL